MTNAELDAAVHERVMGKCAHEFLYYGSGICHCSKCKFESLERIHDQTADTPPPYSTDLNVCRLAENHYLSIGLRVGVPAWEYEEALTDLLEYSGRIHFAMATARERCLAMIEAVK